MTSVTLRSGTRCFGQLVKGELPVDTCHVHFEVGPASRCIVIVWRLTFFFKFTLRNTLTFDFDNSDMRFIRSSPHATLYSECFEPEEVPTEPEEVDAWCMERWRKKAKMLQGVAETAGWCIRSTRSRIWFR